MGEGGGRGGVLPAILCTRPHSQLHVPCPGLYSRLRPAAAHPQPPCAATRRACSTAMADPTRALFFTSLMLDARDAPWVRERMRSSRKGVIWVCGVGCFQGVRAQFGVRVFAGACACVCLRV